MLCLSYVEDTVLETLKLQTQVDMVPAPTRVALGRKGRLWCGSYTEEREEFQGSGNTTWRTLQSGMPSTDLRVSTVILHCNTVVLLAHSEGRKQRDHMF